MISPNIAVRTLPALVRYAGWARWDPTTGRLNVKITIRKLTDRFCMGIFFFYSDARHYRRARVCGLKYSGMNVGLAVQIWE